MAHAQFADPLVRKQFLISSGNALKLSQLAEAEGCAATEIVRRAIDAYSPENKSDAGLEALLTLAEEKLAEARSAVQTAERRVDQALATLDR